MSSYMTRALQAKDPRFAQILEALGHKRPAAVEEKPAVEQPKPKRGRKKKAKAEAVEAVEEKPEPEAVEIDEEAKPDDFYFDDED